MADFNASMLAAGARIAVGLVALATFVLLFLMTGSLVLAAQGAAAQRRLARGEPGRAGAGCSRTAHLEGCSASTSVGRDRVDDPVAACSRSGSGCRWTTRCSCCRASSSSTTQGYANDEAVVLGLQRSGPHHHLGGAAHRHRLRRLRRRAAARHQGDRRRPRVAVAARRHARADAARARDDDAARRLELVGAGAAAPLARPARHHRGGRPLPCLRPCSPSGPRELTTTSCR